MAIVLWSKNNRQKENCIKKVSANIKNKNLILRSLWFFENWKWKLCCAGNALAWLNNSPLVGWCGGCFLLRSKVHVWYVESQHVANPGIYECHITGILNHESRMITRSNAKMSITLNVDFFRIGLIKINLISSILPVFKNRKSYISLHPTHGVHYSASDIFCYFQTLVFPSVYTSRINRFDCT